MGLGEPLSVNNMNTNKNTEGRELPAPEVILKLLALRTWRLYADMVKNGADRKRLDDILEVAHALEKLVSSTEVE